MARRFKQVDDLMMRDRRFRALGDPLKRWALSYLYISESNADGLVHESLDEMSLYSGIPRDDLPGILGDLQDAGRITHSGMDTVLRDWREWSGGSNRKDDDGFIRVNKGTVERVRLNRQALDDVVFEAYVESSGFTTSDAMYAVLNEPDPRGGDRRSEAFKARPKSDQTVCSDFDSSLPEEEEEEEGDVDVDERGRGREESSQPSSSSTSHNDNNNNGLDAVLLPMAEAVLAGWGYAVGGKGPWPTGDQHWEGFKEALCHLWRVYPDDPPMAAYLAVGAMRRYGESKGFKENSPPHPGNFADVKFLAFLIQLIEDNSQGGTLVAQGVARFQREVHPNPSLEQIDREIKADTPSDPPSDEVSDPPSDPPSDEVSDPPSTRRPRHRGPIPTDEDRPEPVPVDPRDYDPFDD